MPDRKTAKQITEEVRRTFPGTFRNALNGNAFDLMTLMEVVAIEAGSDAVDWALTRRREMDRENAA